MIATRRPETWAVIVVASLALAGCKRGAFASCEPRRLEGLSYCVPPGTNAIVRDGVLPGPGGLGGIPSGEQLEATLTKQDGFYVSILCVKEGRKLADETDVITRSGRGTNVVGHTTPGGWELTYDLVDGAGVKTRAHAFHVAAGGRFATCSYTEQNCKDMAAAEAICRSMKPAS